MEHLEKNEKQIDQRSKVKFKFMSLKVKKGMDYVSELGMFGVGETRSPLGGGGGDGFPVEDRGRGRGKFDHRGSGTGSVIPGPAPPRPVAIPSCFSLILFVTCCQIHS
ncbi:unnamed protein product [Camellia sinensis]